MLSLCFGKSQESKYIQDCQKRSHLPGEWPFIDLSSLTAKSLGDRKHWLLIVDDCTAYTWSYFLKEKSELPDKVNELVKKLKAKYNIQVKKIQCDNVGENHALDAMCKKDGNGITIECTAPAIPQKIVLNKGLQQCLAY